MKKLIGILTILLIVNLTFAQDDVAFFEPFENNVNNWTISDTEDASSKIKNGFFIVRNKKKDYTYRFWRSIPIQESSDFAFESKLKQISGSTNHGYGLVWNSNGWGNSYTFEISSNGYFRLTYYKDDKNIVWKEWTKTPYINALGEYNILKVEKIDKKNNFYINGNLVYTCEYKTALGSYQGYYLGTSMIVMIDYMQITET